MFYEAKPFVPAENDPRLDKPLRELKGLSSHAVKALERAGVETPRDVFLYEELHGKPLWRVQQFSTKGLEELLSKLGELFGVKLFYKWEVKKK